MKFWFVPCWSGDFRLEADPKDEKKCILTVENPTVADREKLEPFLAKARERKWLDAFAGIHKTGKTTLSIEAPMFEAGPLLAEKAIADGEIWTAVRHTDGTVHVENGTKVVEPEKAVAAVSVPTPRVGCPVPESCTRRASEVLRTFSTASQWATWNSEGYMKCVGNVTGKAYHVFHRDEAANRGLNRTILDVESGHTLCCWDDTLPPEEEALSLKFAVEHREAWLCHLSESHTGN